MTTNPCHSCIHRSPSPPSNGLPVPGFTCAQNLPYFRARQALDAVARDRRALIAPFMQPCPQFSDAGAVSKSLTLPDSIWDQLETETPSEAALDRLAAAIRASQEAPS